MILNIYLIKAVFKPKLLVLPERVKLTPHYGLVSFESVTDSLPSLLYFNKSLILLRAKMDYIFLFTGVDTVGCRSQKMKYPTSLEVVSDINF